MSFEVGDVFSGFEPNYGIPVLLGFLLTLLFPSAHHFKRPEDRRQYRWLQLLTLLGALIGAKLSMLFGDLRWPMQELSGWDAVLSSGRSITGGLVFGFLTAELLKPLFSYRLPPNDRFAAVLPFSIAIGRVGCHLTGCCLGKAWDGPLAVNAPDGMMRHPAPLYELCFHLLAGVGLVVLLKTGRMRGRLFALFLIAYGVFRFATEPLRMTPKFILGFSGYQLLALSMIPLGLFGLLRQLEPMAGVKGANA